MPALLAWPSAPRRDTERLGPFGYLTRNSPPKETQCPLW
jgi:hypothetical protein